MASTKKLVVKREKEMATHSSIHAWEIPRTKEPGGLQSMGLQGVGHDWATSVCVCVLKSFLKNKVKLAYVVWSQVNGYSGGTETGREQEKGCEGLAMLQVFI